MREYLSNISVYNLRMSNRAYIGMYYSSFFITLRAFKSLYFKVSDAVYFFVLKPEVFCLSVIPNIST